MGKSIPMNMDRLKTDFAGIKMPTPVMGASGTFGFGVEYDDFIEMVEKFKIPTEYFSYVDKVINKAKQQIMDHEIFQYF